MLDFDFFEILDSLTIARSRKHITTYYDTSDIGRFPKRNIPVSIESPLTEDYSLTYVEIAELLSRLNLSLQSRHARQRLSTRSVPPLDFGMICSTSSGTPSFPQ